MVDGTEMSFGELGDLFDGPHATPTRRQAGPYFLNISSLQSGRLNLAASDHVSPEDFSKWTRRVTPRAGDLLFSYETRLGEAALMVDGVQACLGRRMALLRPNLSIVDPRFLLYYYLSPEFQRLIAANAIHGATVSRIGLATMPNWRVRIPGLADQRAIAEVLGALDDKIAANDRVIEVADELRSSLVATSRSTVTVGQIASQHARSLSPATFADMVDHYSLPAFDAGARPDRADRDSIKSNKLAVDGPSVLMSKLNPRIPRVWEVHAPSATAVASTEFVVLAPVGVSTSELWAALRAPAATAELASQVAGTSGSHQRVRPADILALEVADPRVLAGDVRALIDALGAGTESRRAESQCLAATRDELLPLLMSGKVRVRDAEKRVEEVL